MSRKFIGLAVVLILTLACGLSNPATPGQTGVETIVAATFEALTAGAPTQPSGNPVSFEYVSFTIPGGLAAGANGETLPVVTEETGDPWSVAPEHVRFTFNGYSTTGSFSNMSLTVYPAQEYADAYAGAETSLQKLQAILASPSAPLEFNSLPQVPSFNAAQMVAAQVQRLNFTNGSGVRMVTQYGQAVGPITNRGTFYHYQGLTNDGKFLVVVVLPIGSPLLVTGDNENEPIPVGGVEFPGYDSLDPADFESYFLAVTDILNAASPDTFQPSLTLLDSLIQSISIGAP
ncbi:MAG: hypothetical protein IH589_04090 [Anaerolineales bacterium]|nr:hypothetical protein [Anaerolineales bacterium]